MFEWISNNKEWLFSGVGVVIITFFITSIRNKFMAYERNYNNALNSDGTIVTKELFNFTLLSKVYKFQVVTLSFINGIIPRMIAYQETRFIGNPLSFDAPLDLVNKALSVASKRAFGGNRFLWLKNIRRGIAKGTFEIMTPKGVENIDFGESGKQAWEAEAYFFNNYRIKKTKVYYYYKCMNPIRASIDILDNKVIFIPDDDDAMEIPIEQDSLFKEIWHIANKKFKDLNLKMAQMGGTEVYILKNDKVLIVRDDKMKTVRPKNIKNLDELRVFQKMMKTKRGWFILPGLTAGSQKNS